MANGEWLNGNCVSCTQGAEQAQAQAPAAVGDVDTRLVRIQGLPWQVTEGEIAGFFSGLDVCHKGIFMGTNRQGRPSGEGYVEFACKAHRDLAILRNRQKIASRWIAVIAATGGERSRAKQLCAPVEEDTSPSFVIRMRGLPFSATDDHIKTFFAPSVPVEGGVLIPRRPGSGYLTGEAYVKFSDDDTMKAALLKHKEDMGGRFIELFRSTNVEMRNADKLASLPL